GPETPAHRQSPTPVAAPPGVGENSPGRPPRAATPRSGECLRVGTTPPLYSGSRFPRLPRFRPSRWSSQEIAALDGRVRRPEADGYRPPRGRPPLGRNSRQPAGAAPTPPRPGVLAAARRPVRPADPRLGRALRTAADRRRRRVAGGARHRGAGAARVPPRP